MIRSNILKIGICIFLLNPFLNFINAQTDSLVRVFKNLPAEKKNNIEDTISCYLLRQIISDCDIEQIGYYAQQLKDLSDKRLSLLPATHTLVTTYKTYQANSIDEMALAYLDKGDLIKSFDYFFQSVRLFEDLHQNYAVGEVYNDIGGAYYFIGDKDKALEFFEKAYSILKNIGLPEDLTPILSNLAYMHMNKNQLTLSFNEYSVCFSLAKKTGDDEMASSCLIGIGNINEKQGHYEEALENFKVSLAMNEKINSPRGLAASYSSIGNIYRHQKNYNTALVYMEKALKLRLQTSGFFGIREAASSLEDIYEHLGKYKQALEMEKLYTSMLDSTSNEGVRKASLRKQLDYEYDKKALILKDERIKFLTLYEQKRRFYIVLGVILIVLVIITFLSLYLGYRFKKEKESKNIHIELKERLKQEIKDKESIANSLIHIQEHEREKLAAELHDGVNQLLFAAKIQLQASKSVSEDMHKEAVNLVDTAIQEIKSIAANEGSFMLKNKLLKDALTDLILQMKGNQNIEISFLNYGFEEDRLDQDQKTNVLRIIQEMLNNAIKHANARNIYISAKTTTNKVIFAVTDTGKGINVDKKVGGNGLKNISNKTILMKGRQRVFSVEGKGTKLFTILPLN